MYDEGVPDCSCYGRSGTPVGVAGIVETGVVGVAADCAWHMGLGEGKTGAALSSNFSLVVL